MSSSFEASDSLLLPPLNQSPGPTQGSTGQVQPLTPVHQIESSSEGQNKGIGKVSNQPMFSHLWGTD
jgi:hypothetical protein